MSADTTRANKIATVIIPVADQDAAVDFYVTKLGFEQRVDVSFGNGYRWIEVGLADEATTIALAPRRMRVRSASGRPASACRPTISMPTTRNSAKRASTSTPR
jgi:catechol 2,3-dioxygenase-like lactoylglutathione lyase family enzyme